jgi:hypothetical protein
LVTDEPHGDRCFSEDVPFLQQICGFLRAQRVKSQTSLHRL